MKKRREEKQKHNTTLLTNPLSLKTFLITLLSFLLLFSISCSNKDKTGVGGGDTDYTSQVPDAVGIPITAEDLQSYVGNYAGSLTLDIASYKLNTNPPNAFDTNGGEASMPNVSLTINGNNITYNTDDKEWDDIENNKPGKDIIITTFLKAFDGSFQANYYTERINENDYTNKMKYFIKITLGNNNATIEAIFGQFNWNAPEYYHSGESSIISYSELATFNGTLNKDTSSGS